MINTNATNSKMLNAIRETKGRFFGIYTKQGEVINAQYTNESSNYIQIYDRNQKARRRLAKASLLGVRISEQTIGSAF